MTTTLRKLVSHIILKYFSVVTEAGHEDLHIYTIGQNNKKYKILQTRAIGNKTREHIIVKEKIRTFRGEDGGNRVHTVEGTGMEVGIPVFRNIPVQLEC